MTLDAMFRLIGELRLTGTINIVPTAAETGERGWQVSVQRSPGTLVYDVAVGGDLASTLAAAVGPRVVWHDDVSDLI